MKAIFALFLIILSACNMNTSSEINAIKEVLHTQQIAWNNGDIDGFMLGYWQSNSLTFVSKNGVTKGWDATLKNYKTSYPTKASMGSLQFKIIEVKLQNKTTATLDGNWELIRTNDNPKGSFTLTFNKIDGQWFIIKDYTTLDE